MAWVCIDEPGCTLDELAGCAFSRDEPLPLTANEREIVTLYRSVNPQARAAIEAVALSQQEWRDHLRLVP